MNKEEERKKLKIAQELENRLYNKQFLYEQISPKIKIR